MDPFYWDYGMGGRTNWQQGTISDLTLGHVHKELTNAWVMNNMTINRRLTEPGGGNEKQHDGLWLNSPK